MSTEPRKKSSKTPPLGKTARQPPAKAKAKAQPKPKINKSTIKKAATSKTTTKAVPKPGKTQAGAAAASSGSLAASGPAAKPAKSKPGIAASRESVSGAATVPAGGLKAQDPAPDFQLPRDGGGTASLADYKDKKLVLFFYPRANTPGCTREAIVFTRLSKAFADSGTAVLGVSADAVKAQDSFRDKHKLGIPLISDERHQMLEAYGAWGEKSLYGRKFLGIIRSTILIGKDGRIAKIWRNVKVDGHADAVLAAAREL